MVWTICPNPAELPMVFAALFRCSAPSSMVTSLADLPDLPWRFSPSWVSQGHSSCGMRELHAVRDINGGVSVGKSKSLEPHSASGLSLCGTATCFPRRPGRGLSRRKGSTRSTGRTNFAKEQLLPEVQDVPQPHSPSREFLRLLLVVGLKFVNDPSCPC